MKINSWCVLRKKGAGLVRILSIPFPFWITNKYGGTSYP